MYTMLYFLVLFIWFVLRGGLKISYTYIPFLVALFISIWVNEIPAYFKVWFRVLAFFICSLCCRPFLYKSVYGYVEAFAFLYMC